MSQGYRIFGSELSPYSIKVRSYFRYKRIPHEWLLRTERNREEFARYAKLPLVPLVVTPDGEGVQDSTPIIETLERQFPELSIHPADPACAFASALLEEYADEWVNKPMFHYRWFYEADRTATAERIARTVFGAEDAALEKAAAGVAERMLGRLHFVGASEQNRPILEGSLHRLLGLLERHLAGRSYLFGSRPAFADFGLYAQLYECLSDPTAGAIMQSEAPLVVAWCERMLAPESSGEFEDWGTLAPTLAPLLSQEVAGLFLPWSDANARALAAGEPGVALTLDGQAYAQEVQKYHARSLQVLRQRYAGLDATARTAVDAALQETGCLPYLEMAT